MVAHGFLFPSPEESDSAAILSESTMTSKLRHDSTLIAGVLGRVGVFLLACAPYAIGAFCLAVAAWFVASLF